MPESGFRHQNAVISGEQYAAERRYRNAADKASEQLPAGAGSVREVIIQALKYEFVRDGTVGCREVAPAPKAASPVPLPDFGGGISVEPGCRVIRDAVSCRCGAVAWSWAGPVDRNNQPLCGTPMARVVDHGEWHCAPDVERRFLIFLAWLT